MTTEALATFNPDMLSGFWTMPPGHPESKTSRAQDIANARASRFKRWQLVGDFADDATIDLLHSLGITGISVRLFEHQWGTEAGRAEWIPKLAHLKSKGVDTVVMGVEIDDQNDVSFESPDWGQARAEELRGQAIAANIAFKALGLRTCSPAFRYVGHYRDWRDGLKPGWFRWWEWMRPALNECDLTTVHLYSADGTAYDTLERIRVGLWLAQSLANKQVYIGETNSLRGTDVEQAGFLVRLFSLLLWQDPRHPQWGAWAGSGTRVGGACIFVANGTANGWPEGYLMSDLASYELLGRFVSGERWYF